ncbi:MAG: hypothetical protein PQJ46_05010 [Spirochaetales bacterium]|nr:hypothetical protein [Spirochaetales bacterium]
MSKVYDDDYYTNRIFLDSVLPVLKPVAEGKESLRKAWQGKSGICQISCMTPGEVRDDGSSIEKDGTHFVIEDGEWTVKRGICESWPKVELVFKSRKHLNNFFKGKQFPLPSMKGVFGGGGLFLLFMKALLAMGGLLASKEPPADDEDARLLVKCMFYLLSTGISTLNKLEHPKVHPWVAASPDRVYAWAVGDDEELAAYIRIKAGKSKASRGVYRRSMPFFTMRFDSVPSALGILLGTDDMIESTVSGKLAMEGGPEYGAQLGDHMMLIGDLIQ